MLNLQKTINESYTNGQKKDQQIGKIYLLDTRAGAKHIRNKFSSNRSSEKKKKQYYPLHYN